MAKTDRAEVSAGTLTVKISATCLLFLTLIFLCKTSMADEKLKDHTISVPSFTGAPSLDTTLVEIRMGDVNLRVPRNYLETARLFKKDSDLKNYSISSVLTIVTTFPKFTGATPDTIHCYKPLSIVNCPNLIVINTLEPEENVRARNEPAVADAARAPQADLYGLVKVATKTSLVPEDIYVSYGGSYERSVVIACTPTDSGPPLYCRVRLEMPGAPVIYQYNLISLSHWRTIHEGVTRVLRTFYVGGVR